VSKLRDAVVLRRRATPADTAREAAGGGAYLLGERIAVPDVTGPVFARLEVRPSLLGRAWAITFKPAPLRIELELEDGSQLSHRYVAAMGAAGFVISPWVSTSSEFAALYGDHVLSSGRRVVAFTVKAEDTPPASWRPSIAVRFERLSPRPLDDPPRVLIGDEPIAAPSSIGATLVSCDGHLDLLNGHAPTATPQPIGRTLRVSGWLSPDRERGVAPQAVLVVLEGENGRRTLYATALSRRRDVAAHFGVPSLEATGFSGLLDASGLAGPQRLRLAFRDGEAIRVCESVAAVLVPALPAR
jgi:hypothetical protein